MLLLLLMQSYTRLWAGRGRAARTHHSDKGGEEDSHKKQRAELGTGAGGENTHTHTHMSHTHIHNARLHAAAMWGDTLLTKCTSSSPGRSAALMAATE